MRCLSGDTELSGKKSVIQDSDDKDADASKHALLDGSSQTGRQLYFISRSCVSLDNVCSYLAT